MIVSTPFLIKVHELPMLEMHDYWRFTPRGLRTLLERAGLDVVKVRTLGERELRRRQLSPLAGLPALASAWRRPRAGCSGVGIRAQPVLRIYGASSSRPRASG